MIGTLVSLVELVLNRDTGIVINGIIDYLFTSY